MLIAGVFSRQLVWGLLAGEEDDAIEPECAHGLSSDVGMTEVNRVKATAEEANFHV